MKIGSKIRKFRINLNISQSALGKKTGFPQTTISDWERDKSLPNIEEALKLANALEIPISVLIEEDNTHAI